MHGHAAPSSPWPFFVPIGIAVVFIGLGLFSMAFIGAGIVIMVLALLGWYRDAGNEWHAIGGGDGVEVAHGEGATPRFPGWMLGVYGIIFVMATLITLGGWAVDSTAASVRDQAAAAASAAPGSPGGLAIVAQNIQFSPTKVTAPAGAPFDLTFENKDKLPHNWAVYPSATDPKELFKGGIVTGPTTVTYHVPALKAGTYPFRCDVHPTSMTGTLIVD